MKRIIRERYLTVEEVAKYADIRKRVEAEYPPQKLEKVKNDLGQSKRQVPQRD
jgi:hypothetical protein